MVALAIAFSGLVVALAVLFASGVLWSIFVRMEELGHLFFAIARSNLSIDLIDRDIPVPEWLIVDAEDGEEKPAEEKGGPAKVVSLLKSVKDKTEG